MLIEIHSELDNQVLIDYRAYLGLKEGIPDFYIGLSRDISRGLGPSSFHWDSKTKFDWTNWHTESDNSRVISEESDEYEEYDEITEKEFEEYKKSQNCATAFYKGKNLYWNDDSCTLPMRTTLCLFIPSGLEN